MSYPDEKTAVMTFYLESGEPVVLTVPGSVSTDIAGDAFLNLAGAIGAPKAAVFIRKPYSSCVKPEIGFFEKLKRRVRGEAGR